MNRLNLSDQLDNEKLRANKLKLCICKIFQCFDISEWFSVQANALKVHLNTNGWFRAENVLTVLEIPTTFAFFLAFVRLIDMI